MRETAWTDRCDRRALYRPVGPVNGPLLARGRALPCQAAAGAAGKRPDGGLPDPCCTDPYGQGSARPFLADTLVDYANCGCGCPVARNFCRDLARSRDLSVARDVRDKRP